MPRSGRLWVDTEMRRSTWFVAIVIAGCSGSGKVVRWTMPSATSCRPLRIVLDGKPLDASTAPKVTLSEKAMGNETRQELRMFLTYDADTWLEVHALPAANGASFSKATIPNTLAMMDGSKLENGGRVSVCLGPSPAGGIVLDEGTLKGHKLEVEGLFAGTVVEESESK